MRLKSIILLVLALGCGLVAAVGINQALAKRREVVVAPAGEMEPILLASVDVEMGMPITSDMVRLEEWPKGKVPMGALHDLLEIQDRRTRTKIYAGEPVLEFKLLSPGAGDGATALIPKGWRAVALQVDAVSGASSLILPGDRVDVVVYLKNDPSTGIAATGARTILQDVKVFAVNDIFHREPRDADEGSINARTVALLATPEQAELLTLASEMGKIRLVMRSHEDDGVAATAGAQASQLTGGHSGERLEDEPKGPTSPDGFLALLKNKQQPEAAPAPPAPAKNTHRMVIVRGKDHEVVDFVDGVPVTQTTNNNDPMQQPAPVITPAPEPQPEVELPPQEPVDAPPQDAPDDGANG